MVDFTRNNTLEEGVKEHGEDDNDQGEEYSEASEDNLEEFTIIDEYKMEEEDEQQLNKSTIAGINRKRGKRKPSVEYIQEFCETHYQYKRAKSIIPINELYNFYQTITTHEIEEFKN